MDQINVLLVDDHALFREGLRMLLEQHADIKIVGEAGDGFQAIRMVESLQPDIMLLDVQMPRMGGIEVLSKIRHKSSKTKVLILSAFLEDEMIIEALQNGAKGYLLKTLSHKEIARAIRATHSGEFWAERKVLSHVLETLLQKVHARQAPLSEMRVSLTDREQEIVEWVMQGMTNKEVAARLGISEKTVKTHLGNIFSKLKISRRLQLLLYRIADGAS
ncbi:MAG: response regulator transcription factor [Candidatus Methylomirabilis oxyfera]|nr:response regulator transcription factor [Candidatus Methylomirabilis oxyfera]